MDNESITIPIKNEEACVNKHKLLRIKGEKHAELLLTITPLSLFISSIQYSVVS
jgi:hypothetical protein